MLVTSLWNWTIERVAYRPLRGSFRLAPLITAIGMSIVLSNFIQISQGPRNKPIPPLVSDVLHFGNVTIAVKQVIIVVITAILLAAFWYLVNKTPLGRAQRATEQDRKMAALLGVDVDRTPVGVASLRGEGPDRHARLAGKPSRFVLQTESDDLLRRRALGQRRRLALCSVALLRWQP